MKILLQNKKTKEYLQTDGKWSLFLETAFVFANRNAAVKKCREQKFATDIVLAFKKADIADIKIPC